MQKRLLVILLIAVLFLPCAAQKISIGQFKRVKFDLATRKFLPVIPAGGTSRLRTVDVEGSRQGIEEEKALPGYHAD